MSISVKSDMIFQRIAWLMVILLGLFTLAILISGVPLVGYDAYFHLNNLAQYVNLREAGTVIPRWTPNTYFGFGSATFYFYPPLTYWLASVLYPLSDSFQLSFRLFSIEVMFAIALSCRWYLSTLSFNGRAALLGSLFYAVGPYGFFDLVIRSNFPEYLSLALIPLILGGIERSLSTDRMRDVVRVVVISTIGFSVIALTSIPMTIVLVCTLPFYVVIRTRGSNLSRIVPMIIAIILSAMCIAFYLWPIFYFQKATHLEFISAYDQNKWFRTSFLSGVMNGKHITDSFISLLMITLSIAMEFLWIKKWRNDRTLLSLSWATLTAIVILFQIPSVTEPLVRWVPLLGLIQFPSRFYAFVGLSLAVWLTSAKESINRTSGWITAILGAFGIIVYGFFFFYLHSFQTLREFPIEQKTQWNAFEYVPIQVPGDTAIVQSYTKAHQSDPEIAANTLLPAGDTLQVLNVRGNTSLFHISLRDNLAVRFHHFYWPEWRLSASQNQRIIPMFDTNGILIASLPSGTYELKLEIVKSSVEQSGETLSLVGIGILFLLGILSFAFELGRKHLGLPGLENDPKRSSQTRN